MGKHTPGPWAVVVRGNSVKSLAVVGPNGEKVCSGISLVSGDAKLIAQAPDIARQLSDARNDARELQDLFDLQQTRMNDATARWQEATGERNTLPDLGELLQWLMLQWDRSKYELAEARSQLTTCREALRKVEWGDGAIIEGDAIDFCPCCHSEYPLHELNCKLAAAERTREALAETLARRV